MDPLEIYYHEPPEIYHRTFLPDEPFLEQEGGERDTDDRRGALNERRYHPSQRRVEAFTMKGLTLAGLHIVFRIDQDFEGHATPFEKACSRLISADYWLDPLVDATCTVVGHVGRVPISRLYTPALVWEMWQRLPEPDCATAARLLQAGAPVFVLPSNISLPGKAWTALGSTPCEFPVVTAVDGRVLLLLRTFSGTAIEAEGVGPDDIVDLVTGAGFLVTLGSRKKIRSLARWTSRQRPVETFDGPTEDLLHDATERLLRMQAFPDTSV
jgi:hypothetical protein